MAQVNKVIFVSSPVKSFSVACPRTCIIKNKTQNETQFKTNQKIIPNISGIFIKGSSSSFDVASKSNKQRSLLKDAVQNRDWLQRAKENISQEISLFINASNCLTVEVPASTTQYKCIISKGNNSALIKKCMSLRPWWVLVNEDELHSANLIWTQFKNTEHLNRLPEATDRINLINHSLLGKSVTCSALYEDNTSTSLFVDISSLGYDYITKSKHYISFESNYSLSPCSSRIQNKIQHNQHLSDKKCLYKNMKEFYLNKGEEVFEYLPITFHIDSVSTDLLKFIEYSADHPGIWIVKPGENTNRGSGIWVSNKVEKIVEEVSNTLRAESKHTFIIQKYIEKPFLINKRKFDIRLYTLVTAINKNFQAYFYREGYLRTASKVYNPFDLENKFIHLTNDAVQNKCEDYGKFEGGNKLSYQDFQRYLDSKRLNINFSQQILPKIRKIVQDSIKASWKKLNSENKMLSFEIFGYDFLLDSSLKPWLLEVNTNPCLELSSTNLARIIPAMIENALKIAIDPIFPEPKSNLRKSYPRLDSLPDNKFELIFHQYLEE